MNRPTTRRTALVTAASFAGAALLPQGARAQTPLPVVRAVGPPNDGFKAIFWGVSSGIYKKYGLDVQLTIVPSGAAAAAALGGGSAEIAYTNTLTLVQAHDHGIPMVYLATGNILRPGKSPTLLLVATDSPIKTGRDLNGKTLGSASLRDINAMASMNWIDKAGGDSTTIKVVEVPASAGAAFLEQHRADAVVLNEPAASARFTDADFLEVRYLQPLIDACAKYGLISKSFPAQQIISSAAIPPPA